MTNLQAGVMILKILNDNVGDEDFDFDEITAEAIGISETRWEQLLISLQESGYIKGLTVVKMLGEKFSHIRGGVYPNITLEGMTFLEECVEE